MTDRSTKTLTLPNAPTDNRSDREILLETNRLAHQIAVGGTKTLAELEQALYIVDQPLSVLTLSQGVEQALESNGIVSIRQVLEHTPVTLLRYENIGRFKRNEIIEALAAHELRLADSTQSNSIQKSSDNNQNRRQSQFSAEQPIAKFIPSVESQIATQDDESLRLQKGDTVIHPKKCEWGVGRVENVTAEGAATITFANAGEKIISLKHIELDRIHLGNNTAPISQHLDDSSTSTPGKVLCSNCGQPTTFTDNSSPRRHELGWCDSCFKHSQRTFKDSATGEMRYFDELRTVDGIRHKYYSPK